MVTNPRRIIPALDTLLSTWGEARLLLNHHLSRIRMTEIERKGRTSLVLMAT